MKRRIVLRHHVCAIEIALWHVIADHLTPLCAHTVYRQIECGYSTVNPARCERRDVHKAEAEGVGKAWLICSDGESFWQSLLAPISMTQFKL